MQVNLEIDQIDDGDRRTPCQPSAGLSGIEQESTIPALIDEVCVPEDNQVVAATPGQWLGELRVVHHRDPTIRQRKGGEIRVYLADLLETSGETQPLPIVVSEDG